MHIIKRGVAVVLLFAMLMPIPVYAVEKSVVQPEKDTNVGTETTPGVGTETQPETEGETQPSPETQPESETQLGTETETPPETETQPETETETQTGAETETEILPAPETGILPAPETEPQSGATENKNPTSEEETQKPVQSNEQLIANQQIVRIPQIEDDFRFVTVKKVSALAIEELVPVYEERKETSRKVGRMSTGDICYILKEEGEWTYIESGAVRGFVKSASLDTGEEVEAQIKQRESSFVKYALNLEQLMDKNTSYAIGIEEEKTSNEKMEEPPIASKPEKKEDVPPQEGQVSYTLLLEELSEDQQKETTDSSFMTEPKEVIAKEEPAKVLAKTEPAKVLPKVEQKSEVLTYAKALIDPLENKALVYTRTTTRRTVVDKAYAIAQKNIEILESADASAEVVGTLKKDALCYLLAKDNADWFYVESGDVRGFIKKNEVKEGEKADTIVKEKGEENLLLAKKTKEPEENKSLYYTLTSIKEGSVSNSIRTSIVDFALQFVGNAYVWGGTSLTNGADCSGFLQSIYSTYGYSIPRVAEDQAQYGTKILVEDALPGDLIFYAKDGYIYHVVMYIGNGQTVQAANSELGIITTGVSTGESVWATRIISDTDHKRIEQVNQKAGITYESSYTTASSEEVGELLGNFKLTSYCNCAICCGQWADGATASGTVATQGRTVAMAGLPFGTRLVIGGQVYIVEDRGTPYGHVDIYLNSHEEALQFGLQYGDVYLAK